MRSSMLTVLLVVGLACTGCTVDMPSFIGNSGTGITNALNDAQRVVENALEDPFRANPYPVLIGGDGNRVLYATNLGDTTFKFDGPATDYVWPGYFGPSNIYQYADKKRTLVGPLVPASDVYAMATDGRYLAYAMPHSLGNADLNITVRNLHSMQTQIVHDAGASVQDRQVLPTKFAIDDARLAYVLQDVDSELCYLRIEDLTSQEPVIEIESAWFGNVVLNGEWLAYSEETEDELINIVLFDLDTGVSTTVQGDVRANNAYALDLALTPNQLIWSEPTQDGATRVLAYDILSENTYVWVESLEGELAGATDDFLLTEEKQWRQTKADRIIVRRYDVDGTMKKLASFKAEGRAGQSRVQGDLAMWVNDDRKVVLAPLSGGDRTIFKPYKD